MVYNALYCIPAAILFGCPYAPPYPDTPLAGAAGAALLLPLMVELHPYLDHKRQLVAEDGMDRSLTVEWLEIDLLLVADKLD